MVPHPTRGVNGLSGEDNRVLVAQLTTDGIISGSFRVQIFPEGDQVNDVRPDLTFAQPPVGALHVPSLMQDLPTRSRRATPCLDCQVAMSLL